MIRLLVMDMNGTITQEHSGIALAEAAGKKKEAEKIVNMRSSGELKLGEQGISTTKLLKGMSMKKAKETVEKIEPDKEIRELVEKLKEKGVECIIVTTGHSIAARSLAKKLGIKKVYANKLTAKNGVLTGEYKKEIVTPEDKIRAVEKIRKEKGLKKKEIAAIGDSQSDLRLFKEYRGFAYHEKKVLKGKGIVILNPLEILEHLDDK